MTNVEELELMLKSRIGAPALVACIWQPMSPDSATTLANSLNLGGQTADWVIEATRKLEALARLRPGWDSYGGRPLKGEARKLTVQVLAWMRFEELPVPSVVLGSGGTVQLEWRRMGKELDVELRDDNTIEYVKVSPNGDVEEGEGEGNRDFSEKLHKLSHWLVGA
jgi:hypothetical protein